MKSAVKLTSGALIHILSILKTGSVIQKLLRGIYRQAYRQERDLISVMTFFQNKESIKKPPLSGRKDLHFSLFILTRKQICIL
jgi:hypothetical protein